LEKGRGGAIKSKRGKSPKFPEKCHELTILNRRKEYRGKRVGERDPFLTFPGKGSASGVSEN